MIIAIQEAPNRVSCLKTAEEPFCGDMIVQKGEECDCGTILQCLAARYQQLYRPIVKGGTLTAVAQELNPGKALCLFRQGVNMCLLNIRYSKKL